MINPKMVIPKEIAKRRSILGNESITVRIVFIIIIIFYFDINPIFRAQIDEKLIRHY